MAIVRMSPLTFLSEPAGSTGPARDHLGPGPPAHHAPQRRSSELAAYRIDRGRAPCFEVDTPAPRLALAFEHRTRRWTVDGIDDEVGLA